MSKRQFHDMREAQHEEAERREYRESKELPIKAHESKQLNKNKYGTFDWKPTEITNNNFLQLIDID